LPGRWRALQAAWPRDAAIPRPVQADAGRLGAAGLGPVEGGERGRENLPAQARTPREPPALCAGVARRSRFGGDLIL